MQYYLRKIAPLSLRVSTIILCALKVLQPGHISAVSKHFGNIGVFIEYQDFFRNGTHKISSPFIFPPESPVFIGVLGGEGCISTLHHPSSYYQSEAFVNFSLHFPCWDFCVFNWILFVCEYWKYERKNAEIHFLRATSTKNELAKSRRKYLQWRKTFVSLLFPSRVNCWG